MSSYRPREPMDPSRPDWKDFCKYASSFYKDMVRIAAKAVDDSTERTLIDVGNQGFQTFLTLLQGMNKPLAYVWLDWFDLQNAKRVEADLKKSGETKLPESTEKLIGQMHQPGAKE